MTALCRVLPDHEIDDLDDYESSGGGRGLAVARQAIGDDLSRLVAAAGIRGRGGAGFPTGAKWQTVAAFASRDQPTLVVVNAAEGEPGTFKDRLLLRRNPYVVLEGALVAAHAMHAVQVTVAVKASFGIEQARLTRAIDEMAAAGWLDDVGVDVVAGPSEYLFGEETGLLEVLEGRPPFPRVTPPWRRGVDPLRRPNAHSAAHLQLAERGGSSSAPALVDNAETLAHVALAVGNGPEWFRAVGTARSPGTVLCTVTGATRRHGVGEFVIGTSVAEIIEELGGGARPGHRLRAVLSGVANPPLLADRLDTPLGYDTLAAAGSGLGSASFIVIDDSVTAVWVAAEVARYLSVESCGQCEPCKRDGLAIAAELATGESSEQTIDRLGTVARGARCALARQTESVVGALVALEWPSDIPAGDVPRPEDADLMAIVPLVDIVDGRALLDLTHRDKAPDWTYPGEGSRPIWPVQRLADQAVEVRPAHVAERAPHRPLDVPSLDPGRVVERLDAQIRHTVELLQHADAGARPAIRAELRAELRRHLDLLDRVVVPLVERWRADGADIAAYPDHHARHAEALLAADPPDDDAATLDVERAVDEVHLRLLPLLRDGLDDDGRREVASALELEAGFLGLVAPADLGPEGARCSRS